MNRTRIVAIVGAVVAVAAVSVGGYRLYETLDARGKRPTYDPEWQRCAAGDTCVAVPAPCQDWAAVNARHREDAAAYYNHLMTVIDTTELWCASTGNPMMTPFAFCVAGQCAFGAQ